MRGGGRGWGGGRGGGWGRRNWFWATGLTGWQRAATRMPPGTLGGQPIPTPPGSSVPEVDPRQELETLKQQAAQLETAIGQINQRIDEITPKTEPAT